MICNKGHKCQKQDWAGKCLNINPEQAKIHLWFPFWPQLLPGIYSGIPLHIQSPPVLAAIILSSCITNPVGIQKPLELLIEGCLLKYWQLLSSSFIFVSQHVNLLWLPLPLHRVAALKSLSVLTEDEHIFNRTVKAYRTSEFLQWKQEILGVYCFSKESTQDFNGENDPFFLPCF